MKHTILALTLISGAAFADCQEAAQNTNQLLGDLKASLNTAVEEPSKLHTRALLRRIDSVEQSLKGIRIWCHDDAQKLRWANDVADLIDRLKVELGL